MTRILCCVTIIFLTQAGMIGQAFSDEKSGGQSANISSKRGQEIIISGKLFCFVKRMVAIPFEGNIISFSGRSGQPVKKGEILARYSLGSDDALRLQKRVSSFQVDDLEQRLVEINNSLAELEEKKEGLKQLSDQSMASSNSMTRLEREIALIKMKRDSLEKRLPIEREIAEDDMAVVGELLGKTISHGHIPKEGVIQAPIDGHIIWVNPDLQAEAKFRSGTGLFTLGVLDPMVIKAQVHEIEALQIKPGEVAEFTLESVPGRKFKARVSRISWESASPQLDSPSYYEVNLEVPNSDIVLREGLRGKIVFQGAEAGGSK